MKILLLEDDLELCKNIKISLEKDLEILWLYLFLELSYFMLCIVCPKSKCRKIIDNKGSKSYYSFKLVCKSLFSFIHCVSID